jgi:hypothetical protein
MNNDNFFSVDRLIEFGMGMGIAQQMVNSMNNALQDAYLPGSQGSHLPGGQPPALPISFFVVIDDGRQARSMRRKSRVWSRRVELPSRPISGV